MFYHYDIACEKDFKNQNIKHIPVISLEFMLLDSEIKDFNNFQNKWTEKVNYTEKVENEAVIITDSKLRILFSSANISKLTGYSQKEIIGNTPKMFQGELTDETSRKNIRFAIENKLPFKEIVTNYKKDGTLYRCEIEAYPKFDKFNNVINYIAFERIAS
jgi:PAS domain S-box-containing protein